MNEDKHAASNGRQWLNESSCLPLGLVRHSDSLPVYLSVPLRNSSWTYLCQCCQDRTQVLREGFWTLRLWTFISHILITTTFTEEGHRAICVTMVMPDLSLQTHLGPPIPTFKVSTCCHSHRIQHSLWSSQSHHTYILFFDFLVIRKKNEHKTYVQNETS